MEASTKPVPIKCACCGTQTLAMAMPDGRVVIQDRRHGKTHTLELEGVRIPTISTREF